MGDPTLQIPRFHRTSELGFRAVLTEDAPWQVEVVRACDDAFQVP